ncbi:unnamed protein product [Phyllotreta striolata]|uniref:Nose resistant-to-fluoxetine protein N-terminal domain-containing protein n=1 Tax=Phyllotreta striolata TaxID=444603 RepID=A0A9N9THG2_PHYSR|nr:unnamed protein product [Phyllotreta striolata]
MVGFSIFLSLTLLSACICEQIQYINFDVIDRMFNETSHLAEESLCGRQIKELKSDPKQYWNLIDSISKFPWSGVLTSSLIDLGNYDQCLDVKHNSVTGKYCLFGIIIPAAIIPKAISTFEDNDVFKLGLCLPDQCTANDFKLFNKTILNDAFCHTKEDLKKFTIGDFAMILFLAFIASLMILSTGYDIYLYRKQRKTDHQIFLAFSVFTNGKKLFQTAKGNKNQIQIFHGIKTISMAWIISGHALTGWSNYSVINRYIVDHYRTYLRVAYISTSLLTVDTFFYMSGFLVAFLYMKERKKPLAVHIKQVPLMIIHRIIRITPAVAMLYFFTITILKHLGSGPMWKHGTEILAKPCRQYWWTFFLYIQNYFNSYSRNHDEDYCLLHTWYLSADMQMFLVCPLILIPISVVLRKTKKLKQILVGMTALNVFFVVLPIIIVYAFNDYENDYATHARMMSYTIGITMGIYMQETKDQPSLFEKIRHSSLVNLLTWIVVLFLLLACALINQEISNNGYSYHNVVIAHSLVRPVWCCCISWMIYSCYHGYGGIINWILTRRIFQVTSKLSYCMYLTHALVIDHHLMISRTRIWFQDYMGFIDWCGYFIITFVVSVIWTLAFESPMITIERLIFKRPTQKPKDKNIEAPVQEHFKQKELKE